MATSIFPFAVFGLGPTELIVILVILLVLFGGAKLPGLAKGLGQSIKEFKNASKEETETTVVKPVAPAVEAKRPEPSRAHDAN